MFNNPFDSFHNTVIEAKEEREQLDRLLTISTPRERLLIAGIALVLVILAAWLFFGSVARSLTADGVLVEPGENLLAANRTVQVLIWAKRDAASQIKAGMPATIELGMADGSADTLDGEIAAISAVPSSEGQAVLESAVPVSVYRVEVLLTEGLDVASLASRESRIVIELGRQSLIALFRTRRS